MAALPFFASAPLPMSWAAPTALQPMPMPQTQITVGAPHGFDRTSFNAIHTIAKGLNSPIADWRITVLNEPQWLEWQKTDAKAQTTNSTFSVLGANNTYIRAKALQNKRPDEIQDMLAHEMGHIVSGSHDEDTANKVKDKYLKTKSWQ